MMVQKIFYALLLVLFCHAGCLAQVDHKYVYQDTAILNGDEGISTKVIEEAPESDEYLSANTQKLEQDKALHKNETIIRRDSVEEIKNSKPFAYAKNLDSLLQAFQKKYNIHSGAGRDSLKLSYGEQEGNGPAISLRENDTGLSWLERFLSAAATKIFLWSLAGLFVAIILYKLFFAEGFFKGQSKKAAVVIAEETTEPLSADTDYEQLINKAIANKNYRLATRYLYLKALQKLTANGAIVFAADKTNFQYLTSLTGKPYKKEFASLMLAYEYAWYGEFEIDENKFAQIHHAFKNFDNQL